MRVINQIWRGCGYLPHVGDHPGTIFLWMFLISGLAFDGFAGLLIMGAIVVPLYLLGAYERSEYSDSRDKGERQE